MGTLSYEMGWNDCVSGKLPNPQSAMNEEYYWMGYKDAENDPARQHELMTEDYFRNRNNY